jgi:hypothetical protein
MQPTKRRRRGVRVACVAAAALSAFLASPGAGATVMVEVGIEDLALSAQLVVRGTVVRRGTRVVLRGDVAEPETHVWIEVAERIVGDDDARVVHVREPGGDLPDAEVRVSGSPSYEPGEEVVVFLVRDAGARGVYRTLHMTQGKFHVQPRGKAEPLVWRDLSDVALVRWTRSRKGAEQLEIVPPAPVTPMLLSELARVVRARVPGAVPAPSRQGGAP